MCQALHIMASEQYHEQVLLPLDYSDCTFAFCKQISNVEVLAAIQWWCYQRCTATFGNGRFT